MDYREIIINGLNDYDYHYQIEQADKLTAYIDMMEIANKKLNLTAIKNKNDMAAELILGSLAIMKVINFNNINTLIDIGTGAGIPGIPLALILPHVDVTLLDSVGKKVNFINQVIKELDINNTQTLWSRAEDTGRDIDHRENYDIVVSRAVAKMRVLTEYTMPFVKKDGIMCAYKGPNAEIELADAKNAIDKLGGSDAVIKRVDVPYSDRNYNFIIIKKDRNTDKIYPRTKGMPRKKPL